MVFITFQVFTILVGIMHAHSVGNISSDCVNSDCRCTNCGSRTLSFTIFSMIFNIYFNQLAFYPHSCWFLPRVMQWWNWAWNFWLSLVFSPNASNKTITVQYLYVLTLSAMCFMYALILIVTILIILVNIQPHKKTAVHYPSTDPTLLVFLSITCSAIFGMDLSHITNHADGLMFVIICLISACIPLCYIVFYICSWLVKVKGQIRC